MASDVINVLNFQLVSFNVVSLIIVKKYTLDISKVLKPTYNRPK